MANVGNTPTTSSSTAGAARTRQTAADVLLLGATGSTGRLLAVELAARGLSVRLAGRHRGPLEDLARALAADGATTHVHNLDVSDAASLAQAITDVGVVVSTIGPFSRLAAPVIDACLTARTPYVDIANEWSAVRDLLDRDDQARERALPLVTGAGFGSAASETLVLRLVAEARTAPVRVRVAAAPQVAHRSDGVRRTIEESLPHGAITYRGGKLVRELLGSGATVLTFGGARRPMMPDPVGDLEAARRASSAPDVEAYIEDPSGPLSTTGSCAWAEVVTADGRSTTAELLAGDGLQTTALIAAATTQHVLTGAAPGAWTAGRLLGPTLVTDATGARVSVNGRPVSAR
jgi:short subunit dehydrogenase-like uncharacterized protein